MTPTKATISTTQRPTATTATAIDYDATGRRFETFRRLERRITELRISDPHSGELHPRGELQRATDAARVAVRELVDRVIDQERAEERAVAEAAASAAAQQTAPAAAAGLLSYNTGDALR